MKWRLVNPGHSMCYKRQMLAPGMEPKAEFVVSNTTGLVAREYCNLHGLWRGTE